MDSRVEDILTTILNDGDPSTLPPQESRIEELLLQIIDKIDHGGGGGLLVHICTSSEYGHSTGIPTVSSPSTSTLYLVPASSATTGNLFDEWIYADSAWERVGYTNITIPQSDWAQTDTTAADYIKNKPASASGVGF